MVGAHSEDDWQAQVEEVTALLSIYSEDFRCARGLRSMIAVAVRCAPCGEVPAKEVLYCCTALTPAVALVFCC